MSTREHPDPMESVVTQLNKIPKGDKSGYERAPNHLLLIFREGRICFFWRLSPASSMEVAGGHADFSGAGVYGIEVALGFSETLT